MKFVAKCQDCGEQKILEEWMRCKSCFVKWFADALNKSDYLTDDDAWYVIPQLDPAKVDEAVAACGAAKDAAERAEAFNLAKADAAVARMNELEPGITKQAAAAQCDRNNMIREMSRKLLPIKDLQPTKP